jgi:hypothetical protein
MPEYLFSGTKRAWHGCPSGLRADHPLAGLLPGPRERPVALGWAAGRAGDSWDLAFATPSTRSRPNTTR